MPIDALQDFTTLTGAFGQFTQSLNQLQQMKIKVESEKASYAIGQANADFIKRMNLPFGDPNRITTDNFREALEAHQSQVDSFVDNINSPGVKAAVGGAVQQAKSQFDGTIMDHFMPLYVAEVQAKDTSLINDMANNPPSDPAALPAWKAQLDAKMDDSAKLGIYDPAKMQAIRDSVDALTNGRIEANKALVAAGGDMDKAAITLTYGDGIDDRYRKSALEVLSAQAQNNEATVTVAYQNAQTSILNGTASDETLDALSKAIDTCRAPYKAEMHAKLTAAIVSADIMDATTYTSRVISDPNRTYSSLWMAKYRFEQMKNQPNISEKYASEIEAQLRRYDTAMDAIKPSPDDAAKEAYSNYQLVMTAWTGRKELWKGHIATGEDVLVAIARMMKDAPDKVESARTEFQRGGAYSESEVAQSVTSLASIIKMMEAATVSGEDPTIGGMKGFTAKKANEDKVNLIASDVASKLMAYMKSGTIKDRADIDKYAQSLIIPYLRNFDLVGRTPVKGMFGDTQATLNAFNEIDNGTISKTVVDPITGDPVKSNAFAGTAKLFQAMAVDTMAAAIKGAKIPSGLVAVPTASGDLTWEPTKNGDGDKTDKITYHADMVPNANGKGTHMAIRKTVTKGGVTSEHLMVYDPAQADQEAIQKRIMDYANAHNGQIPEAIPFGAGR